MKEPKNYWNNNDLWQEELAILKLIIEKTRLVETTKWGGSVYTLNNKNVVGLGGFKSYFGIWFYNGVFLKDAAKVLIAATDTTKSLRQWRFFDKSELDEKLILVYINEAIVNQEKGVALKPQKTEWVSDFLMEELEKDGALKAAFERFSPYKQTEFLEYIATAKQEKTKIVRFEKIKPMLLANIGLNDKYR